MNKLKNPTAGDVAKAYRNADDKGKQLLKDLYGDDVCNVNVTDLVKSYEDACQLHGIEPMDEAEMLRAGFRQDEIDRRKLETITFALNDGEYPDWTDTDQYKYIPYFRVDKSAPSGFAFDAASYWRSGADAGFASRLCFLREDCARYAGETFIELYASIINNNPSK
jgi:hypothetical protein